MSKFKPGDPKKGGRQPGTPNRTTEQFRELIKQFVETNWETLQTDYKALKPGERVTFLNNLIKHFLPEPLSPAKLTEEQLRQMAEYFIKLYGNDKTNRT